jgi:UDP-N-acetylglucosamine--N-acetylmuramyl-(pentapeptide) pyrophosphoryl-undecaprenol N-acetylglucosamine transferase
VRVIVTGGGTGGHIYPALAIAQGLLQHEPDTLILYVGTRNGMEAELVPAAGIEFAGISGRSWPRRLHPDMIKTAAVSVKALWETKSVLKRFHPDLVVGTGGYVSGPVVLTAALFGIPTLLHEQNAFPGMTNRALARIVKGVMLTFPASLERMQGAVGKAQVVGFPVRPEIGRISRREAAESFGLRPDRTTLLVTGGSRGARSINQAMLTVVGQLREKPDVQLIWAAGQATYDTTVHELAEQQMRLQTENWRIVPYIQDMAAALGCADLIVSRAGAASLAEIMIAGKPALLIPYPYAAENHQAYNAQALADAGAARVIMDKDLNGEVLWREIHKLLSDEPELRRMGQSAHFLGQPDALHQIVELCRQKAWK